ncbi:MAG: hypothetical protein Q4F34_08790, partial [Prevotellaceae bacterium]|nr:hypothetical protein [Prevotellaceae bacterium]
MKKYYLYILILFISLNVIAQRDDDDAKPNPRGAAFSTPKGDTKAPAGPSAKPGPAKTQKDDRGRVIKAKDNAPELIIDEEEIPDSLLHPRWGIQKTTPVVNSDLDRGPADLDFPENIKQETQYRDTMGYYLVGSKMNDSYINVPVFMTDEEYQQYLLKKSMRAFWKQKNDEEKKAGGKEKFDFTDMHFDLGPAEKIFGPGGVKIKTQGT